MSYTEREHSSWLAGFFFNDVWRKILAMFLGCLLYYYCTTKTRENHTPERIAGVPVEIILPPDAVNTERTVPPVTLLVTGNSEMIKKVGASSFGGKVQILSYVSGKPYRHKLLPADFRTPSGVTIKAIEPRELVLNIENVVSRRVPIDIKFDSPDRLPPDYRIARVSCSPDEVLLLGPESQVNELRMVSTVPIPLDRTITDGFDYTAQLRKIDGITITPPRVTVRIEIARKYATRVFRNLPLQILQPPSSGLTASPESILRIPETVVSGPESKLAALTEKNLRLYADAADVRDAGIISVPVGCIFTGVEDTELKIKHLNPAKINLKVVKNSK